MARGEQKRVDLEVRDKVIGALEQLTGQSVTFGDLLERAADPVETDVETKAWMDAELAPPLEPYDRGKVDPETLGEGSLEYVAGEGFVVVEQDAA